MKSFDEKKIQFESLDGVLLDGAFTLTNEKPKGKFLLLHGCPSNMDEYGLYHSNYTRYLTEHGGLSEFLAVYGYNTLRINFRSNGLGMKQEDMKDLNVSGMIADAESAYQVLKREFADNSPSFVVGTSFGGGVSVQWLNNFEHSVSHLFLLNPLLDMRHTLRRTKAIVMSEYGYEVLSDEIKLDLKKQGYSYSGDRKMSNAFFNELLSVDMRKEFARLQMPSSVFHGTIDTSCRYEDSKDFVENYSNGKSKLYTYENAGHGFSGPRDENGVPFDTSIKLRNCLDIFENIRRIAQYD